MGNTAQENLLYLGSKFSKLLKSRFGKGPETCYVYRKENKLFIYLGNFITPAEEALVESNQLCLAEKFRSSVLEVIYHEFLLEASQVIGVPFHHCFHDWNYETNKGIIIVESNVKDRSEDKNDVHFQKALFKLIGTVGSKLHKVPDKFKIVNLNYSTCIVECEGIMLPMDKYLLEKGYSEVFFEHLREMKKGMLTRKPLFEEVFNRIISDIFIIRDYENDRGFIVFTFN